MLYVQSRKSFKVRTEKLNKIICRVPNSYTRQTYFFAECLVLPSVFFSSLPNVELCRVFFLHRLPSAFILPSVFFEAIDKGLVCRVPEEMYSANIKTLGKQPECSMAMSNSRGREDPQKNHGGFNLERQVTLDRLGRGIGGQRQISLWFPLVSTPTCRLCRAGQAIRYLTFMVSFLHNGQSARAMRVLHGDFYSVLSLKPKAKAKPAAGIKVYVFVLFHSTPAAQRRSPSAPSPPGPDDCVPS